MPLIESEATSPETMIAASNFARQIKKQPIGCGEVPGFVVNRILNSSTATRASSPELHSCTPHRRAATVRLSKKKAAVAAAEGLERRDTHAGEESMTLVSTAG
jgi:hypothetical protein